MHVYGNVTYGDTHVNLDPATAIRWKELEVEVLKLKLEAAGKAEEVTKTMSGQAAAFFDDYRW